MEAAALAAAAGSLAAVASLLWPTLMVALAVGAAVEAALAAIALIGRRELIVRLALEPDAYAIPEVRRYGRRFVGQRERERLARWIGSLLDEVRLPPSSIYAPICLPERVAAYASELESLSRELGAPATRMHPASAVACLRLLTRAAESPLYNPDLPAEDLGSILHLIRAGIRSE